MYKALILKLLDELHQNATNHAQHTKNRWKNALFQISETVHHRHDSQGESAGERPNGLAFFVGDIAHPNRSYDRGGKSDEW